jgi:hypothetical protein
LHGALLGDPRWILRLLPERFTDQSEWTSTALTAKAGTGLLFSCLGGWSGNTFKMPRGHDGCTWHLDQSCDWFAQDGVTTYTAHLIQDFIIACDGTFVSLQYSVAVNPGDGSDIAFIIWKSPSPGNPGAILQADFDCMNFGFTYDPSQIIDNNPVIVGDHLQTADLIMFTSPASVSVP